MTTSRTSVTKPPPSGLRAVLGRGALSLIAIVVGSVLVTAEVVTWRMASYRPQSLSDALGQLDSLIAAIQLIPAVAVTGATIYYAKQSRDMAREMRASREDDVRRARLEAARVRNREIRGAAQVVLRALNRSAGAAGSLRALAHSRVFWLSSMGMFRRVRVDKVESLNADLAEVGTAMNLVNSLDPVMAGFAGDAFDAIAGLPAAIEGDDAAFAGAVQHLRAVREQIEARLAVLAAEQDP